MRRAASLLLVLVAAGCGVDDVMPDPPPPPTVAEARAHLGVVIDAGLAGNFERLCARASSTCEQELAGVEHLAPRQRPTIARVSVHQPTVRGESWTSGGVLFVLCGIDASGSPYESEVLVFDAGDELLATAAVFWVGTRVTLSTTGEGVIVGDRPAGPEVCT